MLGVNKWLAIFNYYDNHFHDGIQFTLEYLWLTITNYQDNNSNHGLHFVIKIYIFTTIPIICMAYFGIHLNSGYQLSWLFKL